jgi:hypothetical protein
LSSVRPAIMIQGSGWASKGWTESKKRSHPRRRNNTMTVLTDCPACGTDMFNPHGPNRLKLIKSENDGWIPVSTTLKCTVCGFKFIQFYETSEWCSLLEHEGCANGLSYCSTRSPKKPYNELRSEPPMTDRPPIITKRKYSLKCKSCGTVGPIDYIEYPDFYAWIFYTCKGCGNSNYLKIDKEHIVKEYGDWLNFDAWVKKESERMGVLLP